MILVLGGSGLLGRALLRELGPMATGTAMTRLAPGLAQVDAREPAAVLALARSVRPVVIVNLVAERRPSHWGDLDELRRTNVTTAANSALAARDVNAALLHISTDYVFPSGGPFAPDHPHYPMNAYGRSKSAAESQVRRILPGTVIIRMPVLYGPVQTLSECNLSELVARISATHEPVVLDSWARRRPTHVADVARTLGGIVQSLSHWEGRSVHVSAQQWYSQYEMGLCIGELLGSDLELIQAADRRAADRPRQVDLALDPTTPFLGEYRSMADALPLLINDYLAVGATS